MYLRLHHRSGSVPLRLHYRYIHQARAEALVVKSRPRSSSSLTAYGVTVPMSRPLVPDLLAVSKRLWGAVPVARVRRDLFPFPLERLHVAAPLRVAGAVFWGRVVLAVGVPVMLARLRAPRASPSSPGD